MDVVVKEIMRRDGKERVRIFERPNLTFGAALQQRPEDADAWFTNYDAPLFGAAYASIEIAEREISAAVPWLRKEEKPNQPPEPTR